MSIAPDQLRKITEAALLAAGKPLTVNQLQQLFEEDDKPSKDEFEAAFEDIQTDCEDRGFELIEVATGWRFQVKQDLAEWIGKLWEEKPQKYSRALLETLSLVAYRQPITRGEIEDIRGVAVSSHIMKTLMERNWVKVIGHRDVPGRPAMYATTKEFLDYFSLKSLEELPTLAEIRDLDTLNQELNLEGEELAPVPKSLEIVDEEELAQQEVDAEAAEDVDSDEEQELSEEDDSDEVEDALDEDDEDESFDEEDASEEQETSEELSEEE